MRRAQDRGTEKCRYTYVRAVCARKNFALSPLVRARQRASAGSSRRIIYAPSLHLHNAHRYITVSRARRFGKASPSGSLSLSLPLLLSLPLSFLASRGITTFESARHLSLSSLCIFAGAHICNNEEESPPPPPPLPRRTSYNKRDAGKALSRHPALVCGITKGCCARPSESSSASSSTKELNLFDACSFARVRSEGRQAGSRLAWNISYAYSWISRRQGRIRMKDLRMWQRLRRIFNFCDAVGAFRILCALNFKRFISKVQVFFSTTSFCRVRFLCAED